MRDITAGATVITATSAVKKAVDERELTAW